MSKIEILSIIITLIGVVCFATVFTMLYSSHINTTIDEFSCGRKDYDLIEEYLYNKQEKVQKKKKQINIIKSVCFYAIIIFLLPIFIFSIINKIQGNVTMIHNKSIMVITSGSMSQKNKENDYLFNYQLQNQFNTYDIIILDKVTNKNPIKKYDVIAYTNDQGIHVVHRVIDIIEENGKTRYVTRGDSNNATDKYHPTNEDIIGKYSNKRIQVLGIFILFFQSYSGIITIISVIYCLVMFDYYQEKLKKSQEKRLSMLISTIESELEIGTESLKIDFVESLQFESNIYYFNEQGYIGKKMIDSQTNIEEKGGEENE